MSRRKTNEEFLKEVFDKNEYVRRGEIEILSEYVGADTKIKCRCIKHDYIYEVAPSSLLKNIGCVKCGHERTAQKQTKTHEQFVEELKKLDSSIVVVGYYTHVFEEIEFQCENGHIFNMIPNSILNGYKCPYCSGRKVLVGYNDFNTTQPHLKQFLLNESDGNKYTAGSSKKIMFKCPDCGKEQLKAIDLVVRDGFSCRNCSDNLSYPNRFGRALFDQLPIVNYDTEWQPRWAKPYYYDIHFELNENHYIVELDGQFHFEEYDKFGVSLEERQERDMIKNELAYNHDICMIRINCVESKSDYIKDNIIKSKLSSLFDLSNIDWKLCDANAQRSLVKDVCNLYNLNVGYSEIAKQLHLSESTVRTYVKKGVKLGWCEYDLKKEKRDLEVRHGFPVSVKTIETGSNNIFNSMNACIRWLRDTYNIGIDYRTISKCCETHKPYKGFLFEFIKQTIQN